MFIKIVISIVALILAGLVYWMYKSRKGTLNLSEKNWHYKLLHWMWTVDKSSLKNACPYYWTLVCSLLFLPIYLLIGAIGKPIDALVNLIKKSLPEKKYKEPKLPKPSILDKTPDTKYEWFRLFYTKGKVICEYLIWGILALIGISVIASLYIMPFVRGYSHLGIVMIILTAIVLGSAYLVDSYPEHNKYHYDVYKNFLSGVKGLLLMIPILILELFKFIGRKINVTYQNHCPAIKWD
jgi:hypothetical protein